VAVLGTLDQIVGEAYLAEGFPKEEDMHTGMVPQVPSCGNPETDGGLEGLSAGTLYTLSRWSGAGEDAGGRTRDFGHAHRR
jgi:hypothetical protein